MVMHKMMYKFMYLTELFLPIQTCGSIRDEFRTATMTIFGVANRLFFAGGCALFSVMLFNWVLLFSIKSNLMPTIIGFAWLFHEF